MLHFCFIFTFEHILIFNSKEKHRMNNIYYSYVTYWFYQLALGLFSISFLTKERCYIQTLAFVIASVAVALCSLAIKGMRWRSQEFWMGSKRRWWQGGMWGKRLPPQGSGSSEGAWPAPPQKMFRMSLRKRLHLRAFYVLLNRPKAVIVN